MSTNPVKNSPMRNRWVLTPCVVLSKSVVGNEKFYTSTVENNPPHTVRPLIRGFPINDGLVSLNTNVFLHFSLQNGIVPYLHAPVCCGWLSHVSGNNPEHSPHRRWFTDSFILVFRFQYLPWYSQHNSNCTSKHNDSTLIDVAILNGNIVDCYTLFDTYSPPAHV